MPEGHTLLLIISLLSIHFYDMKKIIALFLFLMILSPILGSHAEARARYGSHRVGGYTSHGKGSHYVGGYVRYSPHTKF
jgi:hypothetical protein